MITRLHVSMYLHKSVSTCMKWSEVKVIQSRPTPCDPRDYIVHGILQARVLEWVAFPFSRESSQPSDQTQVSPALWVDSSPAEQQGKPKNIGVGSLSLLHWIFLTQESNQDSSVAGRFFTCISMIFLVKHEINTTKTRSNK